MRSDRKAFWFRLNSRGDCEAAIRAGALIAFMSILCKGVSLLVYSSSVAMPDWNILLAVSVDIVLLAVLAILVLRRNRLAASVLLLYLVSTWIALWVLGAPSGWVFHAAAALVLITYVSLNSLAMVATFKWHSQFGVVNEQYRIAA